MTFANTETSNLEIKVSEITNLMKDINEVLKDKERNETFGENILGFQKFMAEYLFYDIEYKTINGIDYIDIVGTNEYENYHILEIFNIFAKHLDTEKRFYIINNYTEYGEKEKYVFENGECKVVRQITVWQDLRECENEIRELKEKINFAILKGE